VTFVAVSAGLILIRMPSWQAGSLMAEAIFGLDLLAGWSAAVPICVPALLVVVALGHLAGGLWERLGRSHDLPAPVRAVGYAGAVLLLVTLSPGVGKTFIYVAF
jgi:hypothetical protein